MGTHGLGLARPTGQVIMREGDTLDVFTWRFGRYGKVYMMYLLFIWSPGHWGSALLGSLDTILVNCIALLCSPRRV